MIEPVIRRVARRCGAEVSFREVPAADYEVSYSDGGVVSDDDVARLLQTRFGYVAGLRSFPVNIGKGEHRPMGGR